MQVFDAAGRCTFDSNGQYGRVVAFNPPGAGGVFTGTAGRKYPVAMLQQHRDVIYIDTGVAQGDQTWTYDFRASSGRTTANGAECDPARTYNYGIGSGNIGQPVPPSDSSGSAVAQFLVLDVTGY